MFTKLLVCTDGSPYGDVACQYGFQLAKALKAELTGLHVMDIRMIEGPLLADISGALGAAGYYGGWPQFKSLMEAKGDAVRKVFMDRAAQAGVTATFNNEAGHPVHTILEQEQAFDLVILGQRGENEQFGRELIGSVADRVTRRTLKPCLVTPGVHESIGSILAACDGSPIADKVATLAAALAKSLGTPLTVATVADKALHGDAQVIAAHAAQRCRESGVTAAVKILEGQAGEALLDTIARDKHTLIVMGAHAHNRLRQWFVGCTSQRILADSGIPALLVR